jgi:hypothetical protein
MEGAVPQAVDLPQGFVAVDEAFLTSESPGAPPGGLYSYSIAYGDPLALIIGPLESPFFMTFQLALFDAVANADSFMEAMTSASAEEMEAELSSEIGDSAGIELDMLTVQQIGPVAGIGDEATFIRVRVYGRPPGGNEFALPIAMDIYTIRRDRVIGEVFLIWTPGPPGQQFVTENLAKKMDAGIQAALPQLEALAP